MFKKILVPLDGSELAAKILPHVVDLAKSNQAEVTLVHVCYSPVAFGAGQVTPELMKKAEIHEAKWCSAYMGEAAKSLQGQGVDAKVECIEGVPAREVLAYAEKNNFDLIALATHGKGEVAWVLGSTAERIITHSNVPVLLYRVIEYKPPLLKEVYFTTPGVG
jgi:nucleotide-binding universal stress UspA family protein